MCRPSSKTTTNFQKEKSQRRFKNAQRQQHKPLTPPPPQLAGKSRLATEIKCRFCLVLFKRLASIEDRSESSSPPAASSSSEELEQLSRRSNVGDFTAEEVMSEVHLGCPPGLSGSHYSQFTFSLPTEFEADSSFKSIRLDEDGDLVLTRRSKSCKQNFSVVLQHNITSSIPNVGLQVWRAELLLSDFLLHKMSTSSEFDGIISLELGAGTGLAGILLARVAKTVFLTDHGDEILGNCAKNVDLNSELLNCQATIHVRELDWMSSWPPRISVEDSTNCNRYSWTSSEVEEAKEASLLVAADVIYSDDLTDAFFSTVERLMSRGSEKVLYLALEKRFNFSLDDLDVVANGYSHFRSYLQDDEECEGAEVCSTRCFVGKCIDVAQIPQYVREYDRGNDVEIWQIKYSRRKR